jgi:hypothetical protein
MSFQRLFLVVTRAIWSTSLDSSSVFSCAFCQLERESSSLSLSAWISARSLAPVALRLAWRPALSSARAAFSLARRASSLPVSLAMAFWKAAAASSPKTAICSPMALATHLPYGWYPSACPDPKPFGEYPMLARS